MDNDFYKKVDNMFEESLQYEEIPIVRVKDLKENKILEDVNYKWLMFDSDLNMYKLQQNGSWMLVVNSNFKPVIVYKKIFPNNPSI